ncbi:MAG: hypothetical protein ACLGXA_01305 [Acidobacteriota bacterium]
MKTPSVWLCSALVSALFFASLATPAFAQDVGLGSGPRSGSIFAEVSAARTGQGAGVVWGGSAGGYLQGRVLGFVARATVLPGNGDIHVYDAVVGPRLAATLPFVRLWLEAGGGVGYSGGYYGATGNAIARDWGAAWQADLGVAHRLSSRLEWRMLEVGYSRIYTGSNVSPVMASTGLTVRLW